MWGSHLEDYPFLGTSEWQSKLYESQSSTSVKVQHLGTTIIVQTFLFLAMKIKSKRYKLCNDKSQSHRITKEASLAMQP